jgi:hypothetical protein
VRGSSDRTTSPVFGQRLRLAQRDADRSERVTAQQSGHQPGRRRCGHRTRVQLRAPAPRGGLHPHLDPVAELLQRLRQLTVRRDLVRRPEDSHSEPPTGPPWCAAACCAPRDIRSGCCGSEHSCHCCLQTVETAELPRRVATTPAALARRDGGDPTRSSDYETPDVSSTCSPGTVTDGDVAAARRRRRVFVYGVTLRRVARPGWSTCGDRPAPPIGSAAERRR